MSKASIKEQVRERDGNACVDCGITHEEYYPVYQSRLHVHRLTPGAVYSLDGCVTLCHKCHAKRHKGLDPATITGYKKSSYTGLCAMIHVYCHPELKRIIGEAADSLGMSMNQYVAKVCAEKLGRPDLAKIPRKAFGNHGRPRKWIPPQAS